MIYTYFVVGFSVSLIIASFIIKRHYKKLIKRHVDEHEQKKWRKKLNNDLVGITRTILIIAALPLLLTIKEVQTYMQWLKIVTYFLQGIMGILCVISFVFFHRELSDIIKESPKSETTYI